VLNPLNKGGSGAFQIAARVDHIDLDDAALKNGLTNNFTTGIGSLAALPGRLGRGGSQTSYLLGLNWYPIDYIRFMVNYGRIQVNGGPVASLVDPLSTVPVDRQSYGTDLFQARMQIEF
jgi:phosphate-selective porin OprO/OprP